MIFTIYEPWKIAEFMVETKTKPTSWIQIFRFASNIQQSNIQLRIFLFPKSFSHQLIINEMSILLQFSLIFILYCDISTSMVEVLYKRQLW